MGNFHSDMEVRTPTVGNIISLWPDIINRNTLLANINECLFIRICFKCLSEQLAIPVKRKCACVCVCLMLAQTQNEAPAHPQHATQT